MIIQWWNKFNKSFIIKSLKTKNYVANVEINDCLTNFT